MTRGSGPGPRPQPVGTGESCSDGALDLVHTAHRKRTGLGRARSRPAMLPRGPARASEPAQLIEGDRIGLAAAQHGRARDAMSPLGSDKRGYVDLAGPAARGAWWGELSASMPCP